MNSYNFELLEEEEIAVVLSAIEMTRRARQTDKTVKQQADPTFWRFSSRWWNAPVSVGRARPHRY
ncbi:hypothetical protein SAMN02745225_00564 [Ferrithrix thermotolerans DSM 19514]|uniref:Uncharacterized protein n=1 Tax=Ferrithrix thermotolerans DSM 19514 TaxID=1121881 RepID=A0A1M4TCZ6_9ACTN|nr:hypothetical protein [Ferrithrix thermotolerans]SHE42382.1 hypothetical protein SAMN02745225_00564 [Ferrithrix thermotolerans DSM 19514]